MFIMRNLLTLLACKIIRSNHLVVIVNVLVFNNRLLIIYLGIFNCDRDVLISWLYLGPFYYFGISFIPSYFWWVDIFKGSTCRTPRTIIGLLGYEVYCTLTGKLDCLYVIRYLCWRANILDSLFNFFNEVRVIIFTCQRIVFPR